MKKTLIVIFSLSLLVRHGFSKGNESFLSFNVLNMLVGMITVNYNTKLNDNTSLLIKYFSGGYNISFFDKWEWSSTSYTFGLDFYPKKHAINGFYIGPRLEYQVVSAKHTASELVNTSLLTLEWRDRIIEDRGSFLNIGLDLGKRWVYEGGMGVGISTGIKYMPNKMENFGDEEFPLTGISWSGIALNLGFPW